MTAPTGAAQTAAGLIVSDRPQSNCIFEKRAVRQRARVDHRRDQGRPGGRVVRRHARGRARRRHLGRARHVNGAWTAPAEVATGVQADGTRHPVLESGAVRDRPGRADAVLQGRPEPATLVGHDPHLARRTARPGATRRACPTASSVRSRTSRSGSPTGRCSARPAPNRPSSRASGACTSSAAPTTARPGRSCDPPAGSGTPIDAIQPSILVHPSGRLQAVGRIAVAAGLRDVVGRRRQDLDAGDARPSLPNPSAGTDAVTLADGRHLIVYNHTPKGRTPLNIARLERRQAVGGRAGARERAGGVFVSGGHPDAGRPGPRDLHVEAASASSTW